MYRTAATEVQRRLMPGVRTLPHTNSTQSSMSVTTTHRLQAMVWAVVSASRTGPRNRSNHRMLPSLFEQEEERTTVAKAKTTVVKCQCRSQEKAGVRPRPKPGQSAITKTQPYYPTTPTTPRTRPKLVSSLKTKAATKAMTRSRRRASAVASSPTPDGAG
jgi:hypothetical protein